MASTDGSITFSTKLDNAQLEKELGSLKSKIEKKEKEISDMRAKREKANEESIFKAQELDAEKAKLQEIKDRLADIRAMSKDKSIPLEDRKRYAELIPSVKEELADQQTRVRMLQAEYNRIASSVERYDVKIAEATEKLNAQKEEAGSLAQEISAAEARMREIADSAQVSDQHIVDLNQELAALKARQRELEQAGVGLGYQEYDQIAARIAAITEELKEYQKALQGNGQSGEEPAAPINRAALAGQKMVSILSKAGGALKTIGRAAGSVFKTMKKNVLPALKTAGKSILTAIKNMNVFHKLAQSLGSTMDRLGQTIKQVFIFAVLYEGMKAVEEQMDSYLDANEQFSTGLSRLKGTLLTAFQPIYDAVLPALTTLIHVLSRAVAAVAEFISVLFGTTAKRAQSNAKALNSQAEAASAAGDAAEKASEQMAAFDEVNKLNDTSTGGGNGGGSGEDETGPLFDWEYEDPPYASWGEAFSAFLDKILNGIPQLESAFLDFTNRLNNVSSQMYEMFTFPGVQDKVILIGQELANAFNNLVAWIDWNQLGAALGAGLNLALQFLVNFLYTFDWMNLGSSLAALVNGAVSEIDWNAVGQFLWSGFMLTIEMLAGFILGLDMPALAQAASELAIGFFNALTETLTTVPWDEIGVQIAAFLTNLDWEGIFASIYNAVMAALEAIRGLITGFLSQFGDAADPIINIVNTIIDTIEQLISTTKEWATNVNLEPAAAAFQNLMSAIDPLISIISDGLLWAYENVLLPLAGWVVEEAAPASLGLLSSAIEMVTNLLGPVIEGIKSLWNAMQPVIEWIKSVAIVVIEGLGSIFEKIAQVFQEKGSKIQEIISGIGEIIAFVWEYIEPTMLALKETVGVVFEFIGDIIGTVIGSALDILGGLIDFIVGIFTGDWERAWNGIKSIFEGIWNLIKGIVEGAWNFIKGIINVILGGIEALVNGVINGINLVAGALNKLRFDIPDWVPLLGGKSFGFNIPMLSTISIPRLAQGAVIPPNREFLAVLGDQTSGNNIEAPESLIRRIVREESGGGNTELLQAILEAIKAGHIIMVDRRELGRTVTQEQNRMTRQSGRAVLLG